MKLFRIAFVLSLVTVGLAAVPATSAPSGGQLVVHEWGTFTSFAGSDGVPAHFTPNYTDLPPFVYSQAGPPHSKVRRLERDGTISMETPVLYFYSDRDRKLSVKVDFPRGWLTEWYPYANAKPAGKDKAGESIAWDVRLISGETVKLPGNTAGKDNYYRARETDSVPLQVEAQQEKDGAVNGGEFHGGTLIQREKFLFYRGVGAFPPPVGLKAMGGGAVRVTNNAGSKVEGLVLVHVKGSKVAFKSIGGLADRSEMTAELPAADGDRADVTSLLVRNLTEAGLFEKEAKAMVKTWESAWLGESGTRLLYLVPRERTDELLPLSITPKPDRIARVLVGRQDFLTPEQEGEADRLVKQQRSGQLSSNDVDTEFRRMGRFWPQAKRMAEKRLDGVRR